MIALALSLSSSIARAGNVGSLNGTRFHSYAISLAVNEQYEEALAYFRTAVRLNPEELPFLNDLGVTEMRLGLYEKAYKRFYRALHIDPSYQDALDNLAELEQLRPITSYDRYYYHEYWYRHSTVSRVEHRLPWQRHWLLCPPEYTWSELMQMSPQSLSSLFRFPFVLRNITEVLGMNPAWTMTNHTLGRFNDSRVDFYPQNMMRVEDTSPYFDSLGNAWAMLMGDDERDPEVYDGVDASESGTYIQWNMNHQEWNEMFDEELRSGEPLVDDNARKQFIEWFLQPAWLETCLNASSVPEDALFDRFLHSTHWRMLLIGEFQAGMFNHKDTLRAPAWQLHLTGRKLWHLCDGRDENQGRRMYKAGDVDAFNPHYERFPLFAEATCMQVVAGPGDLVYYPEDYWHQAKNLETPTIAIGSTMLTKQSHSLVAKELRKECEGANRIFAVDRELCEQLEHCYDGWKQFPWI